MEWKQKLLDLEHKKNLDLKQNVRIHWVVEGEENSRFFHGIIKSNISNNRIHGLSVNGVWFTDPTSIKNENDFMDIFHNFHSTGILNTGCNPSFISLVPIVNDVGDLLSSILFKCNGITLLTKVIAKVLANRLKLDIGSVVGEEQTVFIAGHNILDGSLMINESLSWLNRNNKEALLFKVDFNKAFDSLSWSFLDSVMSQLGFPLHWRLWISGCLSSSKTSVLVNGSPIDELSVIKGVRQGDVLAPFLFILAMESLDAVMHKAGELGIFGVFHSQVEGLGYRTCFTLTMPYLSGNGQESILLTLLESSDVFISHLGRTIYPLVKADCLNTLNIEILEDVSCKIGEF
uniref:Reverse transcriptase domain-containing protein n=1 Tax=Lactuca sativa TaxID=4236 RepID=A0A9R1XDC0_LACSA|nr:hypothetical protein LSAT_V11C400220710 [Lactuca sativa]